MSVTMLFNTNARKIVTKNNENIIVFKLTKQPNTKLILIFFFIYNLSFLHLNVLTSKCVEKNLKAIDPKY